VDFQNPLDLDNGESDVQRSVITNDGPAALDGRISGGITQTPNIATSFTSLTLGGEGTLEVSGPVSGPLALYKNNAGTATLSGTNSFDGGIKVYEGTLAIATDASLPTQPEISIYQGGILDASAMTVPVTTENTFGSFNIHGTLIGDVEVAPEFNGNGVVDGNLHALAGSYVYPDYNGTLHVTGDFTLDTGATLQMAFSGPVPEQDHTVMRVTGAVDLAGYLDVNAFDVPPLPAGPFVLIYNDGTDPVNGTFDGIAEGATIPLGGGLAMQITYLANGDGGAVGNDVAVTFLADPSAGDLAITSSAPLIVDLGASFTVSYEIENLGPADVTDANLQITIPANAGFVGSAPAGTLSIDILSIPLPALISGATTTVQLDLTAPATTSSVTVNATVGSGTPDPVFSNNNATTVIAVLPDACLQLTDYSIDTGAGTVSLSIDAIDGVTYMLQSSLDLVDWTDGEIINGYDYPYEFIEEIDETREFFRIIIIPYSDEGGGGVAE
jgi:autotransporter-associated beta strand protein